MSYDSTPVYFLLSSHRSVIVQSTLMQTELGRIVNWHYNHHCLYSFLINQHQLLREGLHCNNIDTYSLWPLWRLWIWVHRGQISHLVLKGVFHVPVHFCFSVHNRHMCILSTVLHLVGNRHDGIESQLCYLVHITVKYSVVGCDADSLWLRTFMLTNMAPLNDTNSTKPNLVTNLCHIFFVLFNEPHFYIYMVD